MHLNPVPKAIKNAVNTVDSLSPLLSKHHMKKGMATMNIMGPHIVNNSISPKEM